MKIGIDASLAARRGSGTGRYAALLVERLLALDPENDYVLYFRSSDREDNPLFPIRGPRITTRITDAPLTLMRIHMNLPVRLARDGVELYHSLGFFLPWLWRGRMVVSIHDIHPVIQRELWGWPGTRAADLVLRAHIPIALRQARRILTPVRVREADPVRSVPGRARDHRRGAARDRSASSCSRRRRARSRRPRACWAPGDSCCTSGPSPRTRTWPGSSGPSRGWHRAEAPSRCGSC